MEAILKFSNLQHWSTVCFSIFFEALFLFLVFLFFGHLSNLLLAWGLAAARQNEVNWIIDQINLTREDSQVVIESNLYQIMTGAGR